MRCLRRGGPGGQHRNKVETAVILQHRPTGLKAEANERRIQARNRSVALFRLRVNLALEVRRRHDVGEVPSRLWQVRCVGGRIDMNPSHDDFPAILAEALDVVAACDGDMKHAAAVLSCTGSQLLKLLKKEPRAVKVVNSWRQRRGLRPLR